MKIWTDGSCLGNPGPGGWAFVTESMYNERGGEPDTTNNRMELVAIKMAIQYAMRFKEEILIFTDSQLSMRVLSRQWEAKANIDLIQDIWDMMGFEKIEFQWVKAHANNRMNNAADHFAKDAANVQRSNLKHVGQTN